MSAGRWYLYDRTAANWPDVRPWLTEDDARAGRGYASEDDALAAAYRVTADYNARKGAGGPDLRAREIVS